MVTSRYWNRKLLVRERCQQMDAWLKQLKAQGRVGEGLQQLSLADLRKLKTFRGERVPVATKAAAIDLLMQPHLYGGMDVVEVLPLEAPEGQPTPRPFDPDASPSTAQLYLLMTVKERGWECNAEMADILLRRCSATSGELGALVDAGLVERRQGRFHLTAEGKAYYNHHRKGRWF